MGKQLDLLIAEMNAFIEGRHTPAPQALSPEDAVERVMTKAREAMMAGELNSTDFHKLDLMCRHIKRPVDTVTMAKALDDGVVSGAVSPVEAVQTKRIMSSPALAQLGDPSRWFSCWDKRPAPAR